MISRRALREVLRFPVFSLTLQSILKIYIYPYISWCLTRGVFFHKPGDWYPYAHDPHDPLDQRICGSSHLFHLICPGPLDFVITILDYCFETIPGSLQPSSPLPHWNNRMPTLVHVLLFGSDACNICVPTKTCLVALNNFQIVALLDTYSVILLYIASPLSNSKWVLLYVSQLQSFLFPTIYTLILSFLTALFTYFCGWICFVFLQERHLLGNLYFFVMFQTAACSGQF